MKSYLDIISISPERMKSRVAGYVTNFRLVTLLFVTILAFGIFGFLNLPRRVNPEVKIPIVFVSTVLPGAGPADVENLLTVPLEDSVQGVANVSKITSSSQESVSAIVIEFEQSVDPDKAKSDVQSAIDTVGDLPEDALDPNVAALDFEDIPVWTFAVVSDADIVSMTQFSDRLKDNLEAAPTVQKVNITGLEKQEIQVLVNKDKIAEYGLSPFQVSQALQAESNSYPSGTVETSDSSFSVSLEKGTKTVEDIRSILLTIDGESYQLGQLADVAEVSAPNQSSAYYTTGESKPERAITFNVYKLPSSDLDDAANEIKEVVNDTVDQYDNRFQIVSITDVGKMIIDQFNDVYKNLALTIVLVFTTLFIFLGIKQATIASITIPLTFLTTFGLMQVFGLSLNNLSMFALLLSLGMVVDTSIVVISAMTTYYKTKRFTPAETGVLVWDDFIAPITTTTLTTVWAFVPLLLATGIIGAYIFSIPAVVSMTLLASASTAVFITLPLMVVILEPRVPGYVAKFLGWLAMIGLFIVLLNLFQGNPLQFLLVLLALAIVLGAFFGRTQLFNQLSDIFSHRFHGSKVESFWLWFKEGFFHGFVSAEKLAQWYDRRIRKIINSKKARWQSVTIVVLFFIFSLILVATGFVKNSFFPSTDEDTLTVQLELPVGTPLQKTNTEALSFLPTLQKYDDIETIITEIGSRADSGSTGQSESNLIKYSLVLKKDRQETSIKLAEDLRDQLKDYPNGKATVLEVEGGPPVGSDIEIKLLGDDLGILEQYADQVKTHLEQQPGVINVQTSLRPGISKLVFVPNRAEMAKAGVGFDTVGGWMRTYASGFNLGHLRTGTGDEKDIIFRMTNRNLDPESLQGLSVINNQGELVPLSSIGSFELQANPSVINREDDNRVITVSAGVQEGFNIPEIGQELERFADTDLNLPSGYSWSTGGANQENEDSVKSIIQAMFLAFILILATMVVQLRSFRKAALVLLVIPLAISGVFILFALTGIELSFPALIGVLALFGIVVNNSIVVAEKMNQNLAVGIPFRSAIADAASSRLEPIMFSSLTTIIGLLPITLSDPIWQGLGGAIIAGLTFSGVVMLIFIPVMYYYLFAWELDKGK